MRTLTQEDKKSIKSLLFIGLDFMDGKLSDHLEDYIMINRSTFTKVGEITEEEFDQWIKEWKNTKSKVLKLGGEFSQPVKWNR